MMNKNLEQRDKKIVILDHVIEDLARDGVQRRGFYLFGASNLVHQDFKYFYDIYFDSRRMDGPFNPPEGLLVIPVIPNFKGCKNPLHSRRDEYPLVGIYGENQLGIYPSRGGERMEYFTLPESVLLEKAVDSEELKGKMDDLRLRLMMGCKR